MTADEVQTLIDGVPCDLCNAPPGLAMYMVAAALIDLSNGQTVPDTTQGLISEANCLFCLVPSGLLPYVMIQAIRGISIGGGGGSGSTLCGDVAPVAAPTGDCGTYYDRVTGSFYAWNSTTATWVPLIV